MNTRGFTLIEVIVYLALFGILMTGAVSSAVALGEGSSRIDAWARLTNEEGFVRDYLRLNAEYADEILLPLPGKEESRLRLQSPEGDSPSEYEAYNRALIERRGSTTTPLTTDDTGVSQFLCVHATGTVCVMTFSVHDSRGRLYTATITQPLYPLPHE